MMKGYRGYSLIEAILASFLLVFTFFMVSSLFHTGLQYSAKVDSRITAANIAERRMTQIRAWAKGRSDWNGYPDGPDPEFSAYDVDVDLEQAAVLFSPSSQLELARPAGDRRGLRTVARRAVVTVTNSRSAPFRLVGIVTRGEAPGGATVAVSPATLAGSVGGPGGPGRPLTAAARDSTGAVIDDDIFFHWAVEPVGVNPSSGHIELGKRDGSRATFRNQVQRRNGKLVARDGTCTAYAYARYNGIVTSGQTTPINLVD